MAMACPPTTMEEATCITISLRHIVRIHTTASGRLVGYGVHCFAPNLVPCRSVDQPITAAPEGKGATVKSPPGEAGTPIRPQRQHSRTKGSFPIAASSRSSPYTAVLITSYSCLASECSVQSGPARTLGALVRCLQPARRRSYHNKIDLLFNTNSTAPSTQPPRDILGASERASESARPPGPWGPLVGCSWHLLPAPK